MEAQLVTCSAEGVYNTINLFETVVPALDSGNAITGFSF
jgi:protein-L-isoaspartate(D-aspartate) O-methyltransferase